MNARNLNVVCPLRKCLTATRHAGERPGCQTGDPSAADATAPRVSSRARRGGGLGKGPWRTFLP